MKLKYIKRLFKWRGGVGEFPEVGSQESISRASTTVIHQSQLVSWLQHPLGLFPPALHCGLDMTWQHLFSAMSPQHS